MFGRCKPRQWSTSEPDLPWDALVKSGNFPFKHFHHHIRQSDPSWQQRPACWKRLSIPSACFTSKSISTSSEMKKLVVKKGIQSRVSAKSVPSWVPPHFLAGQGFLSNGTQCAQKNRQNFFERKSQRRMTNQSSVQSKQKNRKNPSAFSAKAHQLQAKQDFVEAPTSALSTRSQVPFIAAEC